METMNTLNEIGEYVDTDQLKHLKFELSSSKYTVSLVDSTGYEIVKGYGNTVIEAINDLHSCLV